MKRNALAPYPGPDLGGAGGPGPQASHQQGVSHQTPQFLKPRNSTGGIAPPFWNPKYATGPQASHQLNPALSISVGVVVVIVH